MGLEANDLSMKIGARTLFHGISLQCPNGSSLAIVGESGVGKTTLLNMLALILPTSAGSISFDGVEAQAWNERKIRKFWKEKVSFILQDAGLDDSETVGYNITLKHGLRRSHKDEKARAAAQQVGLADRLESQIVELSGGEQRRVAIARAIYKQADYLFADEPTASLDDTNRQLVQDLLLEQVAKGATVIIATHDLTLAAACDQTYTLTKI
ncbi:ATP-binding cassette domain-containing protein [Schaalia sp. lx-100]|uniref:ATP-binding cassette domain-containing protein n=1 Tax=Schaalia sp. lx-100 TaxID=2899081 RepID=UPI001E5196C7|nr:ATP-binding cassette domain-containing protein [Schaalia sp. lx-100]MCD4558075.1 ATP-binding cassette domain-containing protein [Schaalia sp. lx-100]